MSRGQLLIYAGSALGLPDGKRKERFLDQIHNFIKFSQDNGLMSRVLLRKNQRAGINTNVMRSDLTDEGFRFFKAVYAKWSDAIQKGKAETEDTRLLVETLTRLRSKRRERSEAKPGQTTRDEEETKGKQRNKWQRRVRPATKRSADAVAQDSLLTVDEIGEYEAAGPSVYDKADWHVEGRFPDDLSGDQANVHTGMFLAWLCERDLIAGEFCRLAEQVKRRRITGPQAYKAWGAVLMADMLTEDGNQFAGKYYSGQFMSDYRELLVHDLPSFYHVVDTWKNYEILKKRIDRRFQAWRKKDSD